MHDCIVLGIVSESQAQILPRPIERAEVKFSLSDTFSFIFTMVSNRFVRECFVVVVFSNPCHFENHFGLFVHILLYISYLIKTIPHQGNFVTTFIISALAIWVLDGRFITNFVILNLSGSMKNLLVNNFSVMLGRRQRLLGFCVSTNIMRSLKVPC